MMNVPKLYSDFEVWVEIAGEDFGEGVLCDVFWVILFWGNWGDLGIIMRRRRLFEEVNHTMKFLVGPREVLSD